MPIALGTAESSSSFFANQRDTFVHDNSFVISAIAELQPLSLYTFSHLEECRTAFYFFMFMKSDTPKYIRFTGTHSDEVTLCIPNTLYAPFEMKAFESLSDMQHYSMTNAAEASVTTSMGRSKPMSFNIACTPRATDAALTIP